MAWELVLPLVGRHQKYLVQVDMSCFVAALCVGLMQHLHLYAPNASGGVVLFIVNWLPEYHATGHDGMPALGAAGKTGTKA